MNKEAGKKERTEENMYIRLDAEVEKKEDTEKLGIRPGDFIAFDPKFEYVNGFVKAHFLDDKASVAVLIDLMLDLGAETLEKLPVAFFFSPYEEVGHGGSAGYPRSTKELLVVDMGVVGEGVVGKETAVSIAAKDSSGPYDYEMTTKLIELAENRGGIPLHSGRLPILRLRRKRGLEGRLGLQGCSYRPGSSRQPRYGENAR